MPSQKDAVFAKLAVERGYLTQERLDEALEVQRKMFDDYGLDQPLEQALLGKHFLTADQAQELRNAVAVQTGAARLVAGYEVISKLGQGGMGAVYKARKLGSGEFVALKVLPPSLADQNTIARFKRESEVVKRLSHENIMGFVEFGRDDRRKCWFCALELIEGEDLLRRIGRLGMLSEDEAVSITYQVTQALQHAYYNGLVHRDVKPENIMVTPDGTAKLLDLGLARPASMEVTRLTRSGVFVGSPYYCSPEQATGDKDIDIRADIYSLGATLYHMVTGKPPFSGTSILQVLRKHITEKLPWPAEVNPALSDGVCRMITKMMAKDPSDRYQEPKELLRDLDVLTEGAEPKIDEAVLRKSSVAIALKPRAARPRPPSSRRLPRARERIERRRRRGEERAEAPVPQGMSSGAKQALVIGAVAVAVMLVGALLLGGGRKRADPRKRGRDRVALRQAEGAVSSSKGAARAPAPAAGGAPSRVAARLSSPKSGTDGGRVARPGPREVPRKARSSPEAAAEALRKAEKHERESPHDTEGAMVLYRMVIIYHPGTPEAAKAEARLARLEGMLRKPIVVTPTADLETTEPGGTATFEVKLGAAPTEAVRVSLTSSDETEGVIEGAAGGPPAVLTLTFTPADWQTPKRVVVTGRDDPVGDGSPCYTIGLVTSSADPDYDRRAKRLSVRNIDDEAPPPQRMILREWWLPSVGGDSAVLTRKNPPAPTGSEYITSLDGPRDWKGNYNSRIRGHIQPPVGGEYVFYLNCDDSGQLWLSTDHDPANMVKIAGVDSHRRHDWADTAASRAVALQGGQRYYVEVVHREGTSGDHVRVGWRRPDGVSERPIPGSYLSPWYDGPRAPRIASTARAEAYAGSPYSYTVTVTGNPPPRIRVSEDVPWLVFDGIWKLSGAPGAGDVGTAATVTVTAANGVAPDATQKFKIAVKQIDPGLVGWWKLDEGGGSIAHDSSVSGNHGTIHGDPKWTTGRVGGALAFDGKDDYLDCGTGSDFAGKSFTVSAWVRTPGGGRRNFVCGHGIWHAGNQGMHFGFRETNAFTFAFYSNDLNTAATYADSGWHHWAGTYDATTNERRIYRDGAEVASGKARADYQGVGTLLIGARPGPAEYFTGTIDDIRIYSRALPAAEIAELVGPIPPSIVSSAPTSAVTGPEYRHTVNACGNPTPSVTVTGLPGWLRFDGKDTISGAPGAGDVGTTGTISILARNAHGSDGQEFTIEVHKPDLTRGLVGWWKLDETSGETARDSSDSGMHGKLQGMTLPAASRPGIRGAAFSFDGKDDGIGLGRPEVMKRLARYTVAAWVRPDDTETDGPGDTIVAYEGGAKGFQLTWRWEAEAGKFGLMTDAVRLTWTPAEKANGRWYHVAASFDGGTARLYVDGAEEAKGPAGFTPDHKLQLGRFGGGRAFRGLIDDVRIYDRALSPAEIAALAASK